MKIAGIKPYSRDSTSSFVNELKQASFLFDSIGIPMLEPIIEATPDIWFKSELDLLKEKSFLFDAWDRGTTTLSEGTDLKEIQDELDFMTDLRIKNGDPNLFFEASARQCALILNRKKDKPDFFSIPLLKKLQPIKGEHDTRAEVLRIAIDNIPVPDETTSWEKVWEFRSDKDSVGKLANFRVWVNELTRSNLPSNEIRDLLESKLADYRKSLEIHKIKFKLGFLEFVLGATREIIEHIAPWKSESPGKALFHVKQKKIDLMQTELNSPGREIAYIYQIQESF